MAGKIKKADKGKEKKPEDKASEKDRGQTASTEGKEGEGAKAPASSDKGQGSLDPKAKAAQLREYKDRYFGLSVEIQGLNDDVAECANEQRTILKETKVLVFGRKAKDITKSQLLAELKKA